MGSASKEECTLYVTNLTEQVTADILEELFTQVSIFFFEKTKVSWNYQLFLLTSLKTSYSSMCFFLSSSIFLIKNGRFSAGVLKISSFLFSRQKRNFFFNFRLAPSRRWRCRRRTAWNIHSWSFPTTNPYCSPAKWWMALNSTARPSSSSRAARPIMRKSGMRKRGWTWFILQRSRHPPLTSTNLSIYIWFPLFLSGI